MPLSWNEIRHNAIRFSKDWAGVTPEEAEKQTFCNEFFAAFGLPRKTVASFEVPVLKTSGNRLLELCRVLKTYRLALFATWQTATHAPQGDLTRLRPP